MDSGLMNALERADHERDRVPPGSAGITPLMQIYPKDYDEIRKAAVSTPAVINVPVADAVVCAYCVWDVPMLENGKSEWVWRKERGVYLKPENAMKAAREPQPDGAIKIRDGREVDGVWQPSVWRPCSFYSTVTVVDGWITSDGRFVKHAWFTDFEVKDAT